MVPLFSTSTYIFICLLLCARVWVWCTYAVAPVWGSEDDVALHLAAAGSQWALLLCVFLPCWLKLPRDSPLSTFHLPVGVLRLWIWAKAPGFLRILGLNLVLGLCSTCFSLSDPSRRPPVKFRISLYRLCVQSPVGFWVEIHSNWHFYYAKSSSLRTQCLRAFRDDFLQQIICYIYVWTFHSTGATLL